MELKMHKRSHSKRTTLHKVCEDIRKQQQQEQPQSTYHTFELCIEIFIAFHNLIRLHAKDSSDITTELIFHVILRSFLNHITPDFYYASRLNVSLIYVFRDAEKKNHFREKDTFLIHILELFVAKFIISVYLNLCRLPRKKERWQ